MAIATGTTPEDVEPTDVKALTTPMSVLSDQPEVADAENMYLVQHTREHIVAEVGDEWRCDCKGYQYHGYCYHVRRVEYQIGDRSVPDWVDPDALDDGLEVDQ